MKPEDKARQHIDQLLTQAGWLVQDYGAHNITAGPGVAVREFSLTTGFADYLLYVDAKVIGVAEAKKEGATLTASRRNRANTSKDYRKSCPVTTDRCPSVTKPPAKDPGDRFSLVLTNPPFGKKSSIGTMTEEGEVEKDETAYERQDFIATTKNKQLNFLQHVMTLLKVGGRCAIVVPDTHTYALPAPLIPTLVSLGAIATLFKRRVYW